MGPSMVGTPLLFVLKDTPAGVQVSPGLGPESFLASKS